MQYATSFNALHLILAQMGGGPRSACAGPVAGHDAGRWGRGHRRWSASRRGRRPSRRRLVAAGRERAKSRRARLRRRSRVPGVATAAAGSASREHTAGSRGCRGRQPRPQGLGRQRRRRWTLAGHPCPRRACEPVPGLPSESSAVLGATGSGAGVGQRTRATLGGSLPIGRHEV
jgi:hypothetical protein